MDNERSSLATWPYYQGTSMDELRHSLVYTKLELENTKLAVQEELKRRDEHLNCLRGLLEKTIAEKNEAEIKCRQLLLEKLLLQQQRQQLTFPLSGVSSVEDEPRRVMDSNNAFSSSDCDESIVSSPSMDVVHPPQMTVAVPDIEFVPEKPLPEKGKLLQAVMKAGPLLQTLLLAGPLPEWKHPPPPLASSEIPPVTIPPPPPPLPPTSSFFLPDSAINIGSVITGTNCGGDSRKRGLCEVSASAREAKYQRVVFN
ncbi:hypothetical protein BT93_J0551 [Corymbia citriodora subsp. variegata]|nr:hypothetical protein BT93_J0551 [Corymbia citriodora subsp. variegata]